jgi:hypothetical protein
VWFSHCRRRRSRRRPAGFLTRAGEWPGVPFVLSRFAAAVVVAATLAAAAVALASPVALKPRAIFLGTGAEMTLDTKTPTQIVAGNANLPPGQHPPSEITIDCPKAANGSITEMDVGFPGVTLTRAHGHFGFAIAYTWKHVELLVIMGPGIGNKTFLPFVSVKLTGTVASTEQIDGSLSVAARGCSRPTERYQARWVYNIPH